MCLIQTYVTLLQGRNHGNVKTYVHDSIIEEMFFQVVEYVIKDLLSKQISVDL